MHDSVDETRATDEASYPKMPANAWTVLGMLAFGEGLSGYDLKTWADWSLNYFYWSPSFSQVYSELKKLEVLGFVESELDAETDARGRRVYTITPAGTAALRAWARNAEVDQPVLKHPMMVRMWLGHLNEPDRLKEMVREHIVYVEGMRDGAALRAQQTSELPTWEFASMAMRWSARYYQAERDLAEQLLADIEEVARSFEGTSKVAGSTEPVPVDPGRWKRYREGTETAD
ncbi:PadR family transcriptional regulator [Tomitella biformata]|uniref:PadR family transcriptional regulator n=1 Tax=Tomitella biformata TaxID=630403 RepID=UPI0004632128|nr:PadR family transcriptional regulator [Tomitella biformata]